MNWEAIGAIGEAIGGLAVIVTLIYLARQIKSAEKMLRIEIKDRHLTSWADRSNESSLHPERAKVLRKMAQILDDDVDEAELDIWIGNAASFFIRCQATYELYQEGLYTSDDLDYLVGVRMRNMFSQNPRMKISWERSKRSFTKPFVEYVEKEIAPENDDSGSA